MRESGSKAVDDTRCAFCQEPNSCSVALGRALSSCWCRTASIPPELLELVPQDLKGKSCICRQCLSRFERSGKQQFRQARGQGATRW